ncbi:MAG: hypothetical protein F6K10_06005 [Moorea sp. SIO2B7]|nr:hypothetical protein [Moorena sp. SIO2B7]
MWRYSIGVDGGVDETRSYSTSAGFSSWKLLDPNAFGVDKGINVSINRVDSAQNI